jgi:hypothetical protein
MGAALTVNAGSTRSCDLAIDGDKIGDDQTGMALTQEVASALVEPVRIPAHHLHVLIAIQQEAEST